MSNILNIRKAQREAARLVIGLVGISGSGKTRTAIEFAYGLAGYDASKVGFIDTENKRGSLYSDVLKGHPTHPTEEAFWIGDLEPPFSPERYSKAIKEFEQAGVEVLIIDSVTHEWEGDGGAQDVAEKNKSPKTGKLAWNKAKQEHKRFMNSLLQSNMHIIPCLRAREKVKEERVDGKLQVVQLGIQPIQEKNFIFEMTASLMMFDEGKFQTVMKCPGELRDALGRKEGYITAADGFAVRQWIAGGGKIDQITEALRNALRGQTEAGEENLKEKWAMLKPAQRKAVGDDFYNTLLESAREYDAQRAGSQEKSGADALNEELGNE